MIIPQLLPAANGAKSNRQILSPRHLAELRASGLSDQQIAECGFHTLSDSATIRTILRWKSYQGQLKDCLAIPYFDASGKPTDYVRLKPDCPRQSKAEGGKPPKLAKYESPLGAGNRAYLPPSTLAALANASQPLVITEGEKKAAKANQEGFPCIGLTGVYGWQKKRKKDATGKTQGDRELIDDLAPIHWQGRQVFLCYDSDAAQNKMVRTAEWHLAEKLVSLGAVVKVVRLPEGQPGSDGKPSKVGLDDFLVANGNDAFRKLLVGAADASPPEKGTTPNESPDDPHRLARLFIENECKHAGGSTLRYWRGEWHDWDGSAYRVIPEKDLRSKLTASTKAEMDRVNLIAQKLTEAATPTVRKITSRLIGDVAHALMSLTTLPSRVEAPAWIDGSNLFLPAETLACRNGLVHLPSLVAGNPHFIPPTPRFFSPNALDFDFSLKASQPVEWLSFLAKLWPDDPQSISTLQEWFGYFLTPDTRQQKILFLIGPKRSGKGTIARVIRGMIGENNVAGPTLSSLSLNFGLWPLIGKTVAMVQDARLSGRTDSAAIIERLLSISGEDSLTIDRKNLQPVTTRLFTRFMLISNELPKLSDASGALPGRMILLRLTQSWYGKEDTKLTDRLLAERPGILLWAIQGWQRLRDRGYFLQPEASKALIDDFVDLSSPVGAFVRERCEIGPNYQIERSVLFAAWKEWCEQEGRDHPGTLTSFGRDLHAVVPNLGTTQPRIESGRTRLYVGIRLR